jgi:hypothetical protein
MRQCILVASTLALICGPGAHLPSHAEILITVDKTLQRMTVAVDGERLYVWPVSTGRAGYATPAGRFKAFRMEKDHYSKEWDDAPMPQAIFFTSQGHATHGTYEAKRLGAAASDGCVRFSTANAAQLFSLVKQEGLTNTRVIVHGTEPSSAPAVARRTPRERTTREAVLPERSRGLGARSDLSRPFSHASPARRGPVGVDPVPPDIPLAPVPEYRSVYYPPLFIGPGF